MMKGFTIIQPKQRYMTVPEIHEAYGSGGVIAYSCKIKDSVLEGGFVIAVQDKADTESFKKFQLQFKKKYPGKEPVCYLRVEAGENGSLKLTYDSGAGEKTALPAMTVKKSEAESALERIPIEHIARAIITNLTRQKGE